MKTREDYPGGNLPEIAVAGKSNAGKSSLINYLCNNSKLAYVSKQPGKTRLINFFLLNGGFFLVDLPGYGFAKVSKKEKESWAGMAEAYFESTKNLAAVVILTDIRHTPTEDDVIMANLAAHYGAPVIVAATKADKVPKTKRPGLMEAIKQRVRSSAGIGGDLPVVAVSSLKKFGKEELLSLINERLEARGK